MRKLFFVTCIFFVFSVSCYAEYFKINDYNVEIILNKDSSAYIEETVLVDYFRPRHGIYRFIPIKARNMKLRIKIVKVGISDNNDEYYKVPYKTFYKKNNLVIRIGSPNKRVYGEKYYKIFYKVLNAVNNNIFYWNIIGIDWKVPIENVNFSISYPEVSSADLLTARVYYGSAYSKKELTDFSIDTTSLDFSNNLSLPPHNGVTVGIEFPENVFREISFLKKSLWFLADNWGMLIPIVVFIIMFLLWYFIGKDEHGEPIVVRYDPPKNITPAEAGALIDEKVDLKEVTATIFGLADKGYLKIKKVITEDLSSIFKKKRESIKFEKLRDVQPELKPFEKKIMEGIFCFGGNESSIDLLQQKFYLTVQSFKDELYDYITNKDNYFMINPDNIRNLGNYVAKMVFVTSVLALSYGFMKHNINVSLVAGLFLSSIIIYFFSKIMPQKTFKGAKVYRELLGFREFIKTVDTDRLKRMALDNPDIFGKILPYAIALNVEKQWSKKFEEIDIKPPNWYDGGLDASFSGTTLGMMLVDIARINALVGYTPQSFTIDNVESGFGNGFSGGGGISGGGFGGGGGGSW